jgi:hypothetical protein
LVIVGEGLFAQLTLQLETVDAGLAWLVALAGRLNRPVALHLRHITTVLSPCGWSEERLQGWAVAHATVLQDAYGEAIWLYGPGYFTLAR